MDPFTVLISALTHARERLRGRRPARAAFEQAAEVWQLAGRPDVLLPTDYAHLRLVCWHYTTRPRDRRSNVLLEYIAAAQRLPRNAISYSALLRERDYCSGCNDGPYRLENLGICTLCACVWCSGCPSTRARHANGNRVCRCGGEIVG